jgi:hypothetical protein
VWFQAVVYRRVDAAAVNAIASGSQVSTIKAMSHRMARSLSVPAPTFAANRESQSVPTVRVDTYGREWTICQVMLGT